MPPEVLNVTAPPTQKVVLPPAVMVAAGKALTVTVVGAEVVEDPLKATVTV